MNITHLIRKGRMDPITKTDSYGVTILIGWRRKAGSRKGHQGDFWLKKSQVWIDRKAITDGTALTPGAQIIMDERKRRVQYDRETAAHDDGFINGEIAAAAQCYMCVPEHRKMRGVLVPVPENWPFSAAQWRPGERIRELAIAGALFLAEGERLKRLGKPEDALQIQGLAMACARAIDDLYGVGPLNPGPWMSEPTSGGEN